MPHCGPERVQAMQNALEEVMMKVPLEYSTPAIKAYLAKCILKAAAQAPMSSNELVAVATDQISVAISRFT
jgi:hypothetical protein